MYHRVLADDDPRGLNEEPGMIVSPGSFQQQLQTLKQLFTVMPLSEWVERRLNDKPLPAKACAITFDDGWSDNYENALPILEKEQVPATVFAVSDLVGTEKHFWPNRLARILAEKKDKLAQNTNFDWLMQIPEFADHQHFSREQISSIIQSCKQHPDQWLTDRITAMEEALDLQNEKSELMDWKQLSAMANSGLVDIGSHTCNHFRLMEGVSPEIIQNEVINSKLQLQEQLDQPIDLFCYPNGDTSASAVELVRSHYLAAVTTEKGINRANSPLHSLQRIGIHEDIGNTATKFGASLSNWM